MIFGGRTALAEGGLRRGELRFDTAYVYDQGRRFELKGVNATFFEATTGAQQGTLVSREGTYNAATGIMEARGSVVVTRSDGAVLTTPQLRYTSGTNQITSDSAFTLKDPGRGDVEGIGFVTDPSFRELRVQKTIRATGRQPVSLPQ
jgi:LPS export ABC transporter protein LptC